MSNEYTELFKAYRNGGAYCDRSSPTALPWESPAGWPLDAVAMKAKVDSAAGKLPTQYKAAFLAPLSASLTATDRDMVKTLNGLWRDRRIEGWPNGDALSFVRLRADSLIGVVADPKGVDGLQLRRFQAMAADIFESFTTNNKLALDELKLQQALPPLATFGPDPAWGPAALNRNSVFELCGASIGVVSQPREYKDHPLLWCVLGHEAGGHIVMHAIQGLADEVKETVQGLKGLSNWGGLWTLWAEEAAADVLGVLNMGPTYALSLGAWLAAAKKTGCMRTSATILGMGYADEHPVDLLRLHLCRGAIAGFAELPKSKQAWLARIDATIAHVSRDVACIGIIRGDPSTPQKYPLALAAADAQAVGAAIANTPMSKSLCGHSLQDVETWCEDDEAGAVKVSRAAAKPGVSLIGLGVDDAQLLAGATMALAADAALYADINTRLNAALDESFKSDPVFGLIA